MYTRSGNNNRTLDINIEQKQSHEKNCLTQIFAHLIHCTWLENELKRSHGAVLTRSLDVTNEQVCSSKQAIKYWPSFFYFSGRSSSIFIYFQNL